MEECIVDNPVALRREFNDRLNANSVEDFLKPGNRHSLVVAFFVAAYRLFAYAEPSGQGGLRHALCDTDFRNEWREHVETILLPWQAGAQREISTAVGDWSSGAHALNLKFAKHGQMFRASAKLWKRKHHFGIIAAGIAVQPK